MKNAILLITQLCFFCFLTSCDKNGELIEMDTYYYVSTQWYYYSGAIGNHTVEIQLEKENAVVDTVLIDTLSNSTGASVENTFTFSEAKGNGDTRLVLKQLTDTGNCVVLDTLVTITGKKTFNLLKLTSDSDPILFSGYDTSDETEPDSSNQTKFCYYYAVADLPDSVKIVIYNYDTDKLELIIPAVDSLVAHKEEYSEYITLEQGTHLFQLKDASNDTIIQDINILSAYLPIKTAYGYSTALSVSDYKFITALLYVESSKYKDKILFSEEW